jgi:hypothetical protein
MDNSQAKLYEKILARFPKAEKSFLDVFTHKPDIDEIVLTLRLISTNCNQLYLDKRDADDAALFLSELTKMKVTSKWAL